jgi:ABC-type multidrug transport system fused ATPase/permease subunit
MATRDGAWLASLNSLFESTWTSVIGKQQSLRLKVPAPTTSQLIASAIWSVLALLLGGYFFISRERDFAVRSKYCSEMPSDLAIRIEDLSIRYKINVEAKKTLKNAVMRASKGQKVRTRTVEAVNHLNLDIPHGSVVGIVGANGAGKSTLMRSIAGILPPTEGRITVDGKISSATCTRCWF